MTDDDWKLFTERLASAITGWYLENPELAKQLSWHDGYRKASSDD